MQPLKDIGRGNIFNKDSNYITLTEVRDLVGQTGFMDTKEVLYQSLFRITIVSFLDKYNLHLSDVRKSCIHFVSADALLQCLGTG